MIVFQGKVKLSDSTVLVEHFDLHLSGYNNINLYLTATLYFDPSFSNSAITQSVMQGIPKKK